MSYTMQKERGIVQEEECPEEYVQVEMSGPPIIRVIDSTHDPTDTARRL